jgi:glycine cleavage system aminomethyltransferase T
MLKTVRVHDTDETFVEYASVRRVVELASGQVRLELWLDERAGVSRDVVLPAGTAYDVVNAGVYETSRC